MANNDPLSKPSAVPMDSQTLLHEIIFEYIQDKKRKRKWQWIKRGLYALLVIWLSYLLISFNHENIASLALPHVGLIDVTGTIFANQAANGDNFSKGLANAYNNTSMKALIIRIDSPGGSPVQADYMFNALQHYRKQFPKIKTYAVCVDACASAAYYVAAGADEIYANPSSLVGSIGVLYNGFGWVDAMKKIGVSRRLYTSGRYKGFMDPFSPEHPNDEKKLVKMLDIIHQQFIDKVKEGRGSRLAVDDDTFSGLYWTGVQAKKRGLVDGFASSGQLVRDVIKEERVYDYTYKENVLDRLARTIGTAMMQQLPAALGIQPGLQ